ncbi:hypothetical protein LIS82_07940 [Cytobacillus solani]|uniref:hypothetical protein n=1 Tax=Cytobacillus solani TaxID=1637975 RepID=UPI0020792ECB|nr:hypothetical protein [Cytobacillus solani]USK56391.1 hypothetical protein LIS82_07940 [Cytobacillus solani]
MKRFKLLKMNNDSQKCQLTRQELYKFNNEYTPNKTIYKKNQRNALAVLSIFSIVPALLFFFFGSSMVNYLFFIINTAILFLMSGYYLTFALLHDLKKYLFYLNDENYEIEAYFIGEQKGYYILKQCRHVDSNNEINKISSVIRIPIERINKMEML